jgi:hypothetical protein
MHMIVDNGETLAAQQTCRARSHYIPTLLLLAAICLVDLSLPLYVTLVHRSTAGATIDRLGISVVILFGVWIHSDLVRVLGGLWLLVSALLLTEALALNFGIDPVITTWFILACLLRFACSWILLFSTEFSHEIGELRETQPAYKRTLRKLALDALTIAAVAAIVTAAQHIFSWFG